MAFGQFLISKPQGADNDPVAILKDIAKFLCGETDLTNMPSFTPDPQTYIVNTVDAGWEYLREYTSGLSGSCIYGFTMRAPIFNSPGKYKYITLGVRANGSMYSSSGDLDVVNGGHLCRLTHGPTYGALSNFRQTLILDETYYINITVSPRHFFMFSHIARIHTRPTGIVERTRFNSSWDTPDSDWPPFIVHTWTLQYGDTCVPTYSSLEDNSYNWSVGTYIGVKPWFNSQNMFKAVYNVAGMPKYFLYQPKYAVTEIELGVMHPDIPIYAIGIHGVGDRALPSDTCGATVTIGNDEYIVWHNSDYVETTGFPIYVRKE